MTEKEAASVGGLFHLSLSHVAYWRILLQKSVEAGLEA
jgi:hypothetical protein